MSRQHKMPYACTQSFLHKQIPVGLAKQTKKLQDGWRGGLCKVKVRKRSKERKQLRERGRRPRPCSFFSRVFLRLTSTFHLPGTFKRTCACVETSEGGIKSDCQMYLLLAFLEFAHLFVHLSVSLSLRLRTAPQTCVSCAGYSLIQQSSPDFGLKDLQFEHFLASRNRKGTLPLFLPFSVY